MRTREYPWLSERRENGAQADLVIERADNIIDLCEMKFTDGPFELSRENEQKLIAKREVFREETQTRQAPKIVIVSANGTTGTHDGNRLYIPAYMTFCL